MQLPLALAPTWGGRRPGAGRKPTPGRRPGVPHRTRPPHLATHPVHATLRTTSAVRCLRSGRAFPAVLRAGRGDGFTAGGRLSVCLSTTTQSCNLEAGRPPSGGDDTV